MNGNRYNSYTATTYGYNLDIDSITTKSNSNKNNRNNSDNYQYNNITGGSSVSTAENVSENHPCRPNYNPALSAPAVKNRPAGTAIGGGYSMQSNDTTAAAFTANNHHNLYYPLHQNFNAPMRQQQQQQQQYQNNYGQQSNSHQEDVVNYMVARVVANSNPAYNGAHTVTNTDHTLHENQNSVSTGAAANNNSSSNNSSTNSSARSNSATNASNDPNNSLQLQNHHRKDSSLTELLLLNPNLLELDPIFPGNFLAVNGMQNVAAAIQQRQHHQHLLANNRKCNSTNNSTNNGNVGNSPLLGCNNTNNSHHFGADNPLINFNLNNLHQYINNNLLLGGNGTIDMNDISGNMDPISINNAQPLAVHSSAAVNFGLHPSSVDYQFQQLLQPLLDDEPWLEEIKLDVPGLSVEPLSGKEIISRLRDRTNDVITRYIPCVTFLVQCQQELRKGLTLATQRNWNRKRPGMTAKQFYDTYLDHLPQQFFRQNQSVMEGGALDEAIKGIHKLNTDAKASERQGCEAVKNAFLGGMKEGESWGLRKWLSKNGNGLSICTDLECIKKACQSLDSNSDSTKKLAERMRPLAAQALERLKKDIPASYQERSAAHPYLPFFHRLESALRSMSTFDPSDDGVICLDDSDDDDIVVEVVSSTLNTSQATKPVNKKRKAVDELQVHNMFEPPKPKINNNQQAAKLVLKLESTDEDSSSGESDEESVVEVVALQPKQELVQNNVVWNCQNCGVSNNSQLSACTLCEIERITDTSASRKATTRTEIGTNEKASEIQSKKGNEQHPIHNSTLLPVLLPKPNTNKKLAREVSEMISNSVKQVVKPRSINRSNARQDADKISAALDNLASIFKEGLEDKLVRRTIIKSESFWSGAMYGRALSIFATILRERESILFLYSEDDRSNKAGLPPYNHIVKHPLCFHDIASALLLNVHDKSENPICNDGKLKDDGVRNWNMWVGLDLLEALDLVLLNSLGYGKTIGEGKSTLRSSTNKLRKVLWNEIQIVLDVYINNDLTYRKRSTPTRRAETSGFVVYKNALF